jgi:protoporphyrinogen oxidase
MAVSGKPKTYDYLIVGSGAEALLTGLILQAQGLSGALIEKDENLGGLCRPLKYQDQLFDGHLTFWPDNETSRAALDLLAQWVPGLSYGPQSIGALTFHNGQVQPFIGFGEHHVPAAEEYSFFAQPEQLVLNKSIAEIIQTLKEQFKGDIYTQSEVTEVSVEAEHSVVLNGAQKLIGKDIYFFENPHLLAKLLSHDSSMHLSKAATQKLTKVKLWTAVNLMFHHKQEVSQTPAIHMLYGAKEQPCVGRISIQNGLPMSQWLCFLENDGTSDSESQGAAIREMKKQIKRMYPYFTDTVEKEFIIVNKEAYGTTPQALLHNRQLAKAPNLHLGSRFYSQFHGFVGDIASLLTMNLPLSTTQDLIEKSPTSPEATL